MHESSCDKWETPNDPAKNCSQGFDLFAGGFFFTMSHVPFTRISIDMRMVLSKSIDFFSSDFDFDVTRALLLLWNLNVLWLEVATEAFLSFRAQLCNHHDFQVKQQDEWSMDFFIEHASKGTDDMRLTLKKMLRTRHQRYHMQLRHLCSIQKRYLLSQASYDFSKVDSIFYNLLSVNRWYLAYLPWSSSIHPAHPRPLVSWCRLSYWMFFGCWNIEDGWTRTISMVYAILPCFPWKCRSILEAMRGF